MGDYEVRARWKEELVWTPEKWLTDAPEWAKPKRDEILEAISAFCKQSSVPLTIDDSAWVGVDTRTDGT